MRFGVCSISAPDKELQDILETGALLGYDDVEIWGKPPHVLEKSSSEAELIREYTADLDLDISVYGSYLRAGTSEFNTALLTELEFAKQLGVDYVRIWAGSQGYDTCTEEHWNEVVDDVRACVRAASNRSIEITVERHFGSVTDTLDGARDLIEAIDRDSCGLNWQIPLKQARIDGEMQSYVPYNKSEIVADAQELAPLTNNIHIQSRSAWGPDAGWKTRCLMRDAFFDWQELLSIFDNVGFSGIAEIEMTPPDISYEEALREEYKYFQSIRPDD